MDQPTIIITGASHGIGAAAAAIAAEKGARVVLAARDRAALERAAEQIRQRDGTALVVDGDISRYSVCQKIVAETVRTFGRIDAVINNAGIIGPLGLVAELPPEEWARTLEINLLGPVLLCREAIPFLRRTNGRVVNISSIASIVAIAGGSAYSASKAALNHFSKILSVEEPAITVVAYNPGDVNTPMQTEIREKGNVTPFEETHRYIVDLYEKGQLLSPEQAAIAVVMLALAAPPGWSGSFIQFDEERMLNFMREYTAE